MRVMPEQEFAMIAIDAATKTPTNGETMRRLRWSLLFSDPDRAFIARAAGAA